MHPSEHSLQIYEELADAFDRQQNEGMRDLFLLLAADAAFSAGRDADAERLRQRLLRLNPHHTLRAYASFGEAAASPDVHVYLEGLRQKYPVQRAAEMLGLNLPPPGPGADD